MSTTVLPLKMEAQFKNKTMKNYTYLVFDPAVREAIVIDPTWEMEKIDSAVATHELKIKAILVTHGHQDHVHLVKPLVEKHGCDVWMSKADSMAFSFECDNLTTLTEESPFQAARMTVVPWSTPGHTMGCVCYMIDGNFFTGDTLFIEGCGMCFGDGSDPKLLFQSLQRIKADLAPSIKIFPAHSYGEAPGKDFSFLLKNNLYLQFDQEERFVAFRMRKGQANFFNFQ